MGKSKSIRQKCVTIARLDIVASIMLAKYATAGFAVNSNNTATTVAEAFDPPDIVSTFKTIAPLEYYFVKYAVRINSFSILTP